MSTINLSTIRLNSSAVLVALTKMGDTSKVKDGGEHFAGYVLAQVRSWYGANTSKAARLGDKVQTAKELASKLKQTWGSKAKLGTVTTTDSQQYLILATGPARQLVDADASFLEMESHGINLEFAPCEDTELTAWLDECVTGFEAQHAANEVKRLAKAAKEIEEAKAVTAKVTA